MIHHPTTQLNTENFKTLLEFPLVTWALLFLYELLAALAMTWLCMTRDEFWLVADVVFGATTVYVLFRNEYYMRCLRLGRRPSARFALLERACGFLMGPCISGFHPCGRQPSSLVALWATQVT